MRICPARTTRPAPFSDPAQKESNCCRPTGLQTVGRKTKDVCVLRNLGARLLTLVGSRWRLLPEVERFTAKSGTNSPGKPSLRSRGPTGGPERNVEETFATVAAREKNPPDTSTPSGTAPLSQKRTKSAAYKIRGGARPFRSTRMPQRLPLTAGLPPFPRESFSRVIPRNSCSGELFRARGIQLFAPPNKLQGYADSRPR